MFQQLEELLVKSAERSHKPAWIIGSAKSVAVVKNHDVSGTIIGIGDMPWRDSNLVSYDFWITANSIYPVPWDRKHVEDMRRSKARIVLSSISAESRLFKIDNAKQSLDLLASVADLTIYDPRHFDAKYCQPLRNCCVFSKNFIHGKSIQELLSERLGSNKPLMYSPGSTVALHAYALAVLMKCNPIYFCGVEIPKFQHDYSYHRNWKMPGESLRSKLNRFRSELSLNNEDRLSPFGGDTFRQILSDFTQIAHSAEILGIRTFVTSATSSLNLVDGINYAS